MIEEDIMEECPPSRFCLPFLIVKKRVETSEISEKSAKGNQKSKDSTGQETKEKMGKYYRFVLSATSLNSLCKSISWSQPNPQQLISNLKGGKWFSGVDLKSAFFQINLRKGDRPKTASQHRSKTYRFTRMLQGFKNSSPFLSFLIQKVLGNMLYETAQSFVDDIVLFSKTSFEHHLEVLEEFFFKKCETQV